MRGKVLQIRWKRTPLNDFNAQPKSSLIKPCIYITEAEAKSQSTMKFLGETLVQVSLLALLFVAGGSTAAWQPTLDCQTKCGNLTIEYPFGTSPGCYHDESFLITCNQTGTEQKPFLRKGNIEVINISLNGELRILMNSSRACYNKTGTLIDYQDHHIQLTHFALSIKNKITAVGCDSYVYLNNMGVRDSSTGCLSVCNSTPPNDGLCSGDGCCQTPIPIGTSYFAVKPYSFNNHTDVFQFNPCSYAFLVEDGSFNFSASKDLVNLRNTTRFPVVVDWSIGDRKCDQIDNNNSSCRENSICVNSTSGSGYTCECKKGFEGNPYLGCKGSLISLTFLTLFASGILNSLSFHFSCALIAFSFFFVFRQTSMSVARINIHVPSKKYVTTILDLFIARRDKN